MIKLLEQQIANLVRQPETGMGYQVVEVDYASAKRRGIVFNGDLFLWEQDQAELRGNTYESLIKSASASEAPLIRSIRVVSRSEVSESLRKSMGSARSGRPATEGAPKKTIKGESFARFTAYHNDRRITQAGGLTAGTYATTATDAGKVNRGSEAVERYALPDPKPAVFRFPISPQINTLYRQGIVQPAFGHQGGGDEVIFDQGTSDRTVGAPVTLPP